MNENEKKYNSDLPRPASYKSNNNAVNNADYRKNCGNSLPPLHKKVTELKTNDAQDNIRNTVSSNIPTNKLNSNSDNEETQYINYNPYGDTAEINYGNEKYNSEYQPHSVNHFKKQHDNNELRQHNKHYEAPRQSPVPDNNNKKSKKQNIRPEKAEPVSSEPKKKKKRKKKGIISKIITSLISVVVVVFIIYSVIIYALINKINYVESNIVSYSGLINEKHVRNILLIGTDGRSESERGRSDTMILLSINSKTDKIFLTSFMRDSYVDIEGHGWNKLNAAYSFGGAELLIDTIQRNFNIEVTDYVSVNFNAFAAVVDAVNGIEIEISDKEAEAINKILHDEVNALMGDAIDSDYLKGGGKIKLNGKQALSYSRIRYVGNADFERTERQRNVLTKITEKVKSFNPAKITKIIKSAAPEMTTNMTTFELYTLALRAPFILPYDMEQLRVPADKTYKNGEYKVGAVLELDFEKNIEIIEKEIYDN